MKTNRIVIDTNVIASALIFSKTSLIYIDTLRAEATEILKILQS